MTPHPRITLTLSVACFDVVVTHNFGVSGDKIGREKEEQGEAGWGGGGANRPWTRILLPDMSCRPARKEHHISQQYVGWVGGPKNSAMQATTTPCRVWSSACKMGISFYTRASPVQGPKKHKVPGSSDLLELEVGPRSVVGSRQRAPLC